VVAQVIGTSDIPSNLTQFWLYIKKWLPHGAMFYTFGIAAICWSIWKTRNKACFENKLIRNPLKTICYACDLMNYRTGLYPTKTREKLV
jgi:hypothetical protein